MTARNTYIRSSRTGAMLFFLVWMLVEESPGQPVCGAGAVFARGKSRRGSAPVPDPKRSGIADPMRTPGRSLCTEAANPELAVLEEHWRWRGLVSAVQCLRLEQAGDREPRDHRQYGAQRTQCAGPGSRGGNNRVPPVTRRIAAPCGERV